MIRQLRRSRAGRAARRGRAGGGDRATGLARAARYDIAALVFAMPATRRTVAAYGQDAKHEDWTLTWTIEAHTDTVAIDGRDTTLMDETVVLTGMQSGLALRSAWTEFWSVDLQRVRVEHTAGSRAGVITTQSAPGDLSRMASLGDAGTLGSWSSSDGTSEAATWRLHDSDGGGGPAFTVTTRYFDLSGALDATEMYTLSINESGEILGAEIGLALASGGQVALTGGLK